jgi:hypothetical protein
MRRLRLVLPVAVAVVAAALAGGGCTVAATGADLCTGLRIPEALDLTCKPAPELAPGAVEVTPPPDEPFAALSRMTVRPLQRTGPDALAWTDPPEWLRRQMTVDTSSYAGLLAGLADSPDSPFAGEGAKAALQSLENLLSSMGRLPLAACDEPATASEADRWDMRCNFTTAGVGMLVHLRLVARGEERWALTLRSANEQRLRHFEAIANAFAPPAS